MDATFEKSAHFQKLSDHMKNRVHWAIQYGHAKDTWSWWCDRTYAQLKRIVTINKAGADEIWEAIHPGISKIPLPPPKRVCRLCRTTFQPEKERQYDCSVAHEEMFLARSAFIDACRKHVFNPAAVLNW